jgi:hypothetical protein
MDTSSQPVTPAPVPAAPVIAPTPVTAGNNITIWPGAFAVYKQSREAIIMVIETYLLLIVIYFVIGILVGVIFPAHTVQVVGTGGGLGYSSSSTVNQPNPIAQLLSFLLGTLFIVSIVIVILSAVKGQAIKLAEALSKAVSIYFKFLGLSVLIYLSYIGLMLLLAVPFLIWGPRLILAPYYMVDQDLGIMDAYKKSWNESKGNVSKIYGVGIATFLMSLLSIVLVGLYFVLMYAAASALLYFYIKNTSSGTATASVSAPVPATPTA